MRSSSAYAEERHGVKPSIPRFVSLYPAPPSNGLTKQRLAREYAAADRREEGPAARKGPQKMKGTGGGGPRCWSPNQPGNVQPAGPTLRIAGPRTFSCQGKTQKKPSNIVGHRFSGPRNATHPRAPGSLPSLASCPKAGPTRWTHTPPVLQTTFLSAFPSPCKFKGLPEASPGKSARPVRLPAPPGPARRRVPDRRPCPPAGPAAAARPKKPRAAGRGPAAPERWPPLFSGPGGRRIAGSTGLGVGPPCGGRSPFCASAITGPTRADPPSGLGFQAGGPRAGVQGGRPARAGDDPPRANVRPGPRVSLGPLMAGGPGGGGRIGRLGGRPGGPPKAVPQSALPGLRVPGPRCRAAAVEAGRPEAC